MSDINITVNDEIVNIDVIDEPVLVNVINSPGVPGAPGAPGVGVPVGGTTGQVLAKSSATNYDTAWVNVSGGAWGTITGTLSNQTDLQTALDGKFDDPTGTTAQYLRGDGSLATFPAIPSGTVQSVGLTMPSAFSVANSPITTSGTLAVTGAGTSAQYIRGDGQLANFPSSGGGGSAYNYYLNGSVNQGTFGGDVYYEMSKTPVLGAGTNFTRTNGQGNGYIASFITDAGDPSLLNIPGGNWNLEFYFQSSSTGGSPQFYAELYKVNSSNVFTLVASGSTNPEGITNGTTVDQYFTSIPVPQTSLLVTDRLAVRIYVIPAGRTITLHTENSNLCEILTTFSTGLNALNGLTAQVQYFATGTSGTDFGISSATDTHTFNLPTASNTNRGALSSADWTSFNSKVGGSGASGQVAYWSGTSTQTGSNNLFWDNANGRLGIGTNTPTKYLELKLPTGVSTLNNGITITRGSGTGIFLLGNGTSNVNEFIPVIYSRSSTNNVGFAFTASVFSTASTFAAMEFQAQNSTATGVISNSQTVASWANWDVPLMQIRGNGNMILQNGGTFTDGGQRLQVQGTTLLNGNVTFSSSTGMTWDAANGRLGVGTNTPNSTMQIVGSSATTALLNITNNSTLQYPIAVNILFPNITTSSIQAGAFYTGKALTNKNGYGFNYIHVADGSNSNRGSIAFNGADNILSWFATGNLSAGGTIDSGERLQVTGTMKVTGASSFGGNMTLSLNQNASTTLSISNSNNAASSVSNIIFSSNSASGSFILGKFSSSTNAVKIVAATDGYIYNTTAGDIAILNDFATGNIKFAAGGSSTAHMTIKSNGRINMSSLPTSPTGLSSGDLWNNLGMINIV
jgi:hypothetical protein